MTLPPLPEPEAVLPTADSVQPFVALASYGQRQLWLFDQLYGGSAAYNVLVALHLRGPLEPEWLRQSLNHIVQRHESLRTTLKSRGGDVLQFIAPVLVLELPMIDLSGTVAGTRLAEVRRRVAADAARPFDLARGPLLRDCLYRLAHDEHVLALVFHHAVFDGASEVLLIEEIAAHYRGIAAGQSVQLPELELQYADFAEWQRSELSDTALAPSLAHLKERLADAPALTLGSDKPRPAVPSHTGGYVTSTLPSSLIERIDGIGRRHGATLFMTLLTAFMVLLQRYCDHEELVVGTAVAGRVRPELESIIGFFINTVLIRASLDGDQTFPQALSRVRTASLQALDYQDVPFERLADAVQTARGSGQIPLLEAMFILQSTARPPTEFAGIAVEPLRVHNGTAKFDLLLEARRTSDGDLTCALEYSRDVFDDEPAHAFLMRFERLLSGLATSPEAPIKSISVMTEEERAATLQEAAGPETSIPIERVDAMVRRQAELAPKSIAIEGNPPLTYSDAIRGADRIAAILQSEQIAAGARVGVCLERGPLVSVVPLGIWSAGAVAVPLDPRHPTERLRYIIADAEPALIFVDETTESLFDGLSVPRRRLEPSLSGPRVAPQPLEDVNSPAYVLYTSGSTGWPKGVVVPHRALTNFMISMQAAPGMNRDDVLVAITTVAFDIAMLELFLPLTVGARLAIAKQHEATDPQALLQLLALHRATIMQATPATWRMLLEAGWEPPPSFVILTGGEALPQDLADALVANGARTFNLYGPTETTIWSSVARVEGGRAVHLGRPIANTQLYVLDGNREPVPRGCAGELYIAGSGLALAYHNKAELTSERFVRNPFSSDGQARMYRTGDRIRVRHDGLLEFIGRVDSQIKLRGFRIEPVEIEAALRSTPAVTDAVVVLREDRPGDKRLVAYVTLMPGTSAPASQLREALRTRLPEYMVPSAFVQLTELPRTFNGKLDRRNLPPPGIADVQPVSELVGPRNEVEAGLVSIWRDVLGLTEVGINDNFFDLGGHSLLALRLFAEIDKRMGRQLRIGLLLEHPTIARLAQTIAGTSGKAPASPVMTLQPYGTRPPLFLIHGIGGEVWSYLPLANRLAPDVPVHGVHVLDGVSDGPITVKSMASRYVDAISALNTDGPFYLGGFCSGAVIALEMAHQLLDQGKQVALVVILDHALIDTAVPRSQLGRAWDLVRNLPLWAIDDLLAVGVGEVWGRIKSRARGFSARMRRRQRPDHAAHLDVRDALGMWRFPDYQVPLLETQWAAIRAHQQRARPYPGPCVLLKPRTLPLFHRRQSLDLGWRRFIAGELTILEVPGSHETMLREPFAATLSARLRPLLGESGLTDAVKKKA